MSYRLADGSSSTEYKIGDKFTHKYNSGVFKLIKNDGTHNPWFERENIPQEASSWYFLTPVK
jgi:hypothetical protein